MRKYGGGKQAAARMMRQSALTRVFLNFGIAADLVALSKYNSITLPSKDIWGAVMPRDSPLAEKKSIRIKDLQGAPLIMSKQALKQSRILPESAFSKWFDNTFDQRNIAAAFTLGYNAFILVNEGIGYCISFDKLAITSIDSNFTFRPLAQSLNLECI